MTLFSIILFSLLNIQTTSTTLEVKGINSSGNLMIACFDKDEGFLKEQNAFFKKVVPISLAENTTILLETGNQQQAVAVFLDTNNNQKLDTNLFGVPTEPYGFSNNPKVVFSAPTFNECSFTPNTTQKVSITLK